MIYYVCYFLATNISAIYLFAILVKKLKTKWIVSMTKFLFISCSFFLQVKINLIWQSWCIGLTWQSFGSRGAAGVVFCEKALGATPGQTKLVPASSKTLLLIVTAEPISDTTSPSVAAYLLNCNKHSTSAVGGVTDHNLHSPHPPVLLMVG